MRSVRALLTGCALVALTGCGAGGIADILLNPLAGTYTLIGFDVTFDNGSTLNQSQVASFNGSFLLYQNGTWSQTIVVEGSSRSDGGTWTASGGTLNAHSATSNCTASVAYTFDGLNLVTTSDHQCGSTVREVDRWIKTGPAPSKP